MCHKYNLSSSLKSTASVAQNPNAPPTPPMDKRSETQVHAYGSPAQPADLRPFSLDALSAYIAAQTALLARTREDLERLKQLRKDHDGNVLNDEAILSQVCHRFLCMPTQILIQFVA
jgi:hypothetical protein